MKLFILLVTTTTTALIVSHSALMVSGAVDSSSGESKPWKSELIVHFLNESDFYNDTARQLDRWCAGLVDKLLESLRELEKCEQAISDNATVCESIRMHGLKCMRPVLETIAACIPEGSKDIPDLIAKGLISAADYVCKQDGEHIFEFFNVCVYEFAVTRRKPLDREVERCYAQQGQVASREIGDKFPSKAQVCNWAIGVKSCYVAHLNKACENRRTKGAHLGLFNAILEPCIVAWKP